MIEIKDIKGKIDKLVDRLKNDDALKAQFKKDPIKAVESVLGVDLPDEAVKKIIAEAKTKLAGGKDEAGNAVEKAGAAIGEAAGKVTGAVGGAVDALKKKL